MPIGQEKLFLHRNFSPHTSINLTFICSLLVPVSHQMIRLSVNSVTLEKEKAPIWNNLLMNWASQVALVVKEPTCQCRRRKRHGFDPWVGKIPWRRAWQPTPVFLPGESHGQRNLVNYSPWVHEELETTDVWVYVTWIRTAHSLI